MSAVALEGLPADDELKTQIFHMWSSWLVWAVASPEKRRALAQLGVSDEITPESQHIAHRAMTGVAGLLEKARARGPMSEAPLTLVVGLMNAMAETTVDFMIRNPAKADEHSNLAFEAVWRMLT